MTPRLFFRKLRSLTRASTHRKLLAFEACWRLLFARLDLVFHPFREVAARLGSMVPANDPRIPPLVPGAAGRDAQLAKDIGWAVRTVAPWMPFRAVCLQQALAAHTMLRKRGIRSAMHFGAGRGSDKPIDAHAWLDAAGVKVTGYPVGTHLAELGCFV